MKPHYSAFKDCHKGEAMIVVANGPSLKDVPLGFLSSLPSFACNRITMMHPDYCPTYYMGLGGNHVNSPEKRATLEPMLSDPRLKAAFLNRLLYHEFDHGPNVEKQYSVLGPRFYGGQGEAIRDFSLEPLFMVGLGFTNVYPMLQVAYYMGVQTVYLVGLDHNYPDTPNKHFYKDGEGHTSHFEIAPGPYTNAAWQRGADRQFEKAKAVYDQAGREIWNLTPGSKCDVFPRKDLSEVWHE